jgi:hypothetical protein
MWMVTAWHLVRFNLWRWKLKPRGLTSLGTDSLPLLLHLSYWAVGMVFLTYRAHSWLSLHSYWSFCLELDSSRPLGLMSPFWSSLCSNISPERLTYLSYVHPISTPTPLNHLSKHLQMPARLAGLRFISSIRIWAPRGRTWLLSFDHHGIPGTQKNIYYKIYI